MHNGVDAETIANAEAADQSLLAFLTLAPAVEQGVDTETLDTGTRSVVH